MTVSMKTSSILKTGIVFACIFFHAVVWGFDGKELLKIDIAPYLSASYGMNFIDGCEDLDGASGCDDGVTGQQGSHSVAAGVNINNYLGVEIGYLPEFRVEESASSEIDDTIEIQGGYIAPSFALPLAETTKIFTKPGAFWGKITENNNQGVRGGNYAEEGVSLFLDAGIDHRITENFSLQFGFNWLPDIADTSLTTKSETNSDGAGETAEIDVVRIYLGASVLLSSQPFKPRGQPEAGVRDFDRKELLKTGIHPYLSASYAMNFIDGCEELNDYNNCDDSVTGQQGSYGVAAGVKINDYFGVELGYLPEFSVYETSGSDNNDRLDIEGGYIAPSFALPLTETTKIFTKPGAFWGKITENDRGSTPLGTIGPEEGVSLFLDAGIDQRITKNFSLQFGFNWLPDIADTNLTSPSEDTSDGAGETAEIDVVRIYLGASVLLW
jgi:hypothetical protein